jgi:hypothetical protein
MESWKWVKMMKRMDLGTRATRGKTASDNYDYDSEENGMEGDQDGDTDGYDEDDEGLGGGGGSNEESTCSIDDDKEDGYGYASPASP